MLGTLTSGWWWLGAGILLAIAEMLLPGVFLIWLGVAAMLTGLATLVLGLPLGLEFALFAVAAIGTVFAGRRWFALNPIETSNPLLNEPVARLIGETVVVIDAIEDGRGRVRVGDGVWSAEGPDAPVGTRVQVTGVRGAVLLVG